MASNRGNWLGVIKNRHRIFNPERKARQFPDYIERWVTIDESYPQPIVDHAEVMARRRRGLPGARAPANLPD